MLSWHQFRDWQPISSPKLTMGHEYGGFMYLNIQHEKRSQAMKTGAETEAADKDDKKPILWRLTARLNRKEGENLIQDPVRA